MCSMGKKGRSAKTQSKSSTVSRSVGSCKTFQPKTLTKRLEKRQEERKHKRQNGFAQVNPYVFISPISQETANPRSL